MSHELALSSLNKLTDRSRKGAAAHHPLARDCCLWQNATQTVHALPPKMGGRDCQPSTDRQPFAGVANPRNECRPWEGGKEGCRTERKPVGSQECPYEEVLWKRIAAAIFETINVSSSTDPYPCPGHDQREGNNCRAHQRPVESRRSPCREGFLVQGA